MSPAPNVLRTRSLRARLALGFGGLLALATLNLGGFYWGARQRARVFGELSASIARHSALTEARTELEDHYKRVKVMSDLLGVERAPLGAAERARTLQTIDGIRRRVGAALADSAQSAVGVTAADTATATLLRRVRVATDSLVNSWSLLYVQQVGDPAQAIAEVVLVAEPLAQRLLGTDLPAAIAAQRRRVDAASLAFVRADRMSSELVWAILALSGLVSAGLAVTLSRDLLRAVDALKAGVERFGAGELAYRVSVRSCEELEEVGESLNTMAGRLRQARDELEVRNQELAHLAFRDPLTKLANRALFRERVERALGTRRPEDVSILFIDLDDFKSVNDTLGHAAGDRLLVDVAERLLNATRGSDTVARLGGDEFAIMLGRVRGVSEAELVARRVLDAMQEPFVVGDERQRAVRVSPSVGVACAMHGCGADELLRNADVAMYRAKAGGKGRYQVFAPAMHAALLDRVELEAELREALDREQLAVVYQPIVDLESARVVSFESLVRWHHPERGFVSPVQFIPLAEESGTILRLGRWVMARACEQAVRWSSLSPVSVSVNVSGRQLDDPGFVDDVRDVLAATGLPAARLTLEITETVIMRDSASTLTRLRELKALGVQVAIDDFGTGYSSLAYLQQFPVDVLKIDKAFVDQVARGGNDAAIARTIVALGEMLALRTVAEGIEEPEQRAGLQLLGCELGQGYLFSRPLAADAAAEFLERSLGAGEALLSVA